jgi:hypothetical protein
MGHLISGTVLCSGMYGMQWWLLTHTAHILQLEIEHLLIDVESLRNILLSFIATQN